MILFTNQEMVHCTVCIVFTDKVAVEPAKQAAELFYESFQAACLRVLNLEKKQYGYEENQVAISKLQYSVRLSNGYLEAIHAGYDFLEFVRYPRNLSAQVNVTGKL